MRHLRYLLIAVLIAVAVWRLSPHFADFASAYKLRDTIQPFWIVMALLSQSLQYLADGWLSQLLLKMIGFKISVTQAVKIASLNVFAAHLLPIGEAGSLATIYYFYKKLGVDNQGIIFLSLSWTAITSVSLILLFLTSLVFVPSLPQIPISSVTYLQALTIATAALVLIYIARNFLRNKIMWLLSKTGIHKELVSFKNNLKVYEKVLAAHKLKIGLGFVAAIIYYLSNILTLTFSFLTLGYFPSLPILICAYTLSLLAGIITLAPAGIGATEATLLVIFLQFKIPAPTALAAILIFRLISFWIPIPAGFLSYMSLRKVKA